MGLDMMMVAPIWLLATWSVVTANPAPDGSERWSLLDQVVDYVNTQPGAVMTSAGVLIGLLLLVPLLSQLIMGETLGKRVLGLRVVDRATGERPPWWLTLLHCVARVVLVALCFIGPLWAWADTERRTLHDRLARMIVIRHGVVEHEQRTTLTPRHVGPVGES